MPNPSDRVPLPGSESPAHPDARPTGPVASDRPIAVTVRVRGRRASPSDAELADLAATPPALRHYPSREEYAAAHGADPADIAKVEAFARDHGLAVVDSDPARSSVVLSGTADKLGDAFGVALQQFDHPSGPFRGHSGPVHIPADLAPVVEGVFGLDDRPIARPHT
jgi:kumamolisin